MAWILVLVFGGLGAVTRFSIDSWISAWAFSFPVGTLIINIAGSLIAGFLFGYGFQRELLSPQMRLGLLVGFCGGFTTFSGFAIQLLQQLHDGKVTAAIAYALASVTLCLLAAAAGLTLSKWA